MPRIFKFSEIAGASALFIVIAALLTTFQSVQAQSSSDSNRRISSVREQWEKAWNEKNLTELLTLYADDAVLLSNGKRITGRDNIENYLKEIIKYSADLDLKNTKTEDSKGLAYDSGRFQYTFRPPALRIGSDATLKFGADSHLRIGDTSRRVQGDYRMTLKREKGDWLIIEHTWNEVPASPDK